MTAEQLTDFRLRQGWTVDYLTRMMGISEVYYYRLLHRGYIPADKYPFLELALKLERENELLRTTQTRGEVVSLIDELIQRIDELEEDLKAEYSTQKIV